MLIIHEDAPVTDAMLSWREKANNFISFTKGEKEKSEAIAKIKSYPHPAEIAEKEEKSDHSRKSDGSNFPRPPKMLPRLVISSKKWSF